MPVKIYMCWLLQSTFSIYSQPFPFIVDLFCLQSTFFYRCWQLQSTFSIYSRPFCYSLCGSSATFCAMYHNTHKLGVGNWNQKIDFNHPRGAIENGGGEWKRYTGNVRGGHDNVNTMCATRLPSREFCEKLNRLTIRWESYLVLNLS